MQRDIQKRLTETSFTYLDIGLKTFHSVRNDNFTNFQAALGNLCIAVEMMLKALIANRCFRHLYTNLPLELEIKLTYPNKDKKFSPSKIDERDLRNFSYKTKELDKCVSIFYTLYPDKKSDYKPYFSLLTGIRNICVHGAIASFQKYDLERVAYISMHLFKHLQTDKITHFHRFKFTHLDEQFYSSYDDNRVLRVRKAIESAKVKSKKIDYWASSNLDEWSSFVIPCPICDCDAELIGSTEYSSDWKGMYLTFQGDSFKCHECGLELLDTKELNLVNIDSIIDRFDELDKWIDDYWHKYPI